MLKDTYDGLFVKTSLDSEGYPTVTVTDLETFDYAKSTKIL